MGFPPGQFSGSLSSSSSFLRPRCGKCSSGGYCSAIWVGDRVEGGAGAAVGVEVGSVVEGGDWGDWAGGRLVGGGRLGWGGVRWWRGRIRGIRRRFIWWGRREWKLVANCKT